MQVLLDFSTCLEHVSYIQMLLFFVIITHSIKDMHEILLRNNQKNLFYVYNIYVYGYVCVHFEQNFANDRRIFLG